MPEAKAVPIDLVQAQMEEIIRGFDDCWSGSVCRWGQARWALSGAQDSSIYGPGFIHNILFFHIFEEFCSQWGQVIIYEIFKCDIFGSIQFYKDISKMVLWGVMGLWSLWEAPEELITLLAAPPQLTLTFDQLYHNLK